MAVFALCLLALPVLPASAAGRPVQIVSLNVCTDQLLMQLADRAHIASVSFLAADPATSAMAGQAAGLHLNHGLAEEILPLQPDLVLAGTHTAHAAGFLLRRLGYRLVEVPLADSFDDIRRNIRTVADAIGAPARGAALIAEFDARLSGGGMGTKGNAPLAAIYQANGYTTGTGTLEDAVLQAAGYRTMGQRLGLRGISHLPLERLLMLDPDALVIGERRDAPALANELFDHPALRQAFAGRPVVSVPSQLWSCGTPAVAEAVALLRAARRQIAAVRVR
jgi:iron complex transport system substrate-binding protein